MKNTHLQRLKNRADILIIDGNNMMYRAYYKFEAMRGPGGIKSSIVFGFPYMLKPLITEFKPKQVMVVFDGNRNKNRLSILPTYKQRVKKEGFDFESFDSQREDLIELLLALNVSVIREMGQEADDIIYHLTRKFKGRKIHIVSSDKDFHQLISDTVRVFSPSKDILLDKDNLINHFPYSPTECIKYLSLIGDDSDNIPGVKGIGPVKARKMIDTVPFTREALSKLNIWDIYEKNRSLIDLKYFYLHYNIRLKNSMSIRLPVFKPTVLHRICANYGISVLRREDFWEVFEGLETKLK